MYDDNFYDDKTEPERKPILWVWAVCAAFAALTMIGAITLIKWILNL